MQPKYTVGDRACGATPTALSTFRLYFIAFDLASVALITTDTTSARSGNDCRRGADTILCATELIRDALASSSHFQHGNDGAREGIVLVL